MEVFQPISWQAFRKSFDQDEPPALEDGSSFGRKRHHAKQSTEEDPHNLEERYYRYGIKPEWLIIERIICHEWVICMCWGGCTWVQFLMWHFYPCSGKGKDLRYLVKWRGLPYTECTWEFPSELPEGLQDWNKHVETHLKRRWVLFTLSLFNIPTHLHQECIYRTMCLLVFKSLDGPLILVWRLGADLFFEFTSPSNSKYSRQHCLV